MSDVFTKRRPIIDLDEFERRLRLPCATDQRDGDSFAELLHSIGDKDEAPKTDFTAIEAGLTGAKQSQAAMPRHAEKLSVEYKRPNARAPLISGDFAAIEAGLLGTQKEKITAAVAEIDAPNVFPSMDLGSDRWLYQDSQPDFRHGGGADRHIKSRRPLYVMGAIVIAGAAGIAVTSYLNSQLSDPPAIALVNAGNGPDEQQTETASNVDVPARDAALLSKPSEPSPIPIANGTERPLDLPQADEKSPPAGSQAQINNDPPVVPVAPASAPAEPLNAGPPVKSDPLKTDLAQQPESTVVPNVAPPQANTANTNETPISAPQSPAPTKAPAAKAAGRVAKPVTHAAVKHPGNHAQPRQLANKAKATPASPITTEPPASAGPAKAEAPAAQPSSITNGAFGFVQSAVDSLTSTTAKLFEWGRN